jgi:esterase
VSELNYDIVRENEPSSWMLFLPGIFGQGRNWNSVARRVVRQRPEWGAVMVDLRMHGGSLGFAPPHTIGAAAADLASLAEPIGAEPAVVVGHSFGGKVALEYLRQHPDRLRQLWVIDSTPAPREPGGSAWAMLRILRSLPDVFASRSDVVAALERSGVATPIASWMATNLAHRPDGYRWRFDLDAMEELLRDFFATDLWDVVDDPPGRTEIHVVKASESSILTPDSLERIRNAAPGRVFLHEVQGGHWLNADNPDAVVALLAERLPE